MTNDAVNLTETESKNYKEQTQILQDAWSIRPCAAYKDEYDDCTSIKARFHQYFIHGHDTDCTQWKVDYENCLRYEKSNGNDVEAGKAIIKSEENRRNVRLAAHYNNTTWKKRIHPPKDWAAPLPDWMEKRNEGTYLEMKQKEMMGHSTSGSQKEDKSFCSIM